MTDEDIEDRITNQEDGWTERKLENEPRARIRKTLVAFANSVPDEERAILFIGVQDDGKPIGVKDSDQMQKNVREWADDCHPPIRYTARVINVEGKAIVAVIVQADPDNRPHFSGPAYVRRGSESIKANESQYSELIASRNSKARDILKAKRNGETVVVIRYLSGFGNHNMRAILGDCVVGDCSPTLATFHPKIGEPFVAEYSQLRLTRMPDGKQLKVESDF
jgi:predicted HTH transcriptional regulator